MRSRPRHAAGLYLKHPWFQGKRAYDIRRWLRECQFNGGNGAIQFFPGGGFLLLFFNSQEEADAWKQYFSTTPEMIVENRDQRTEVTNVSTTCEN